jgi:hypothetical protein
MADLLKNRVSELEYYAEVTAQFEPRTSKSLCNNVRPQILDRRHGQSSVFQVEFEKLIYKRSMPSEHVDAADG